MLFLTFPVGSIEFVLIFTSKNRANVFSAAGTGP